jgi:hypothetical protein
MYATVQEAAEGQTNADVRRVFETLKENIETVQGKFVFLLQLRPVCSLFVR